MKVFIIFLVLVFNLQSWAKADDIKIRDRMKYRAVC